MSATVYNVELTKATSQKPHTLTGNSTGFCVLSIWTLEGGMRELKGILPMSFRWAQLNEA